MQVILCKLNLNKTQTIQWKDWQPVEELMDLPKVTLLISTRASKKHQPFWILRTDNKNIWGGGQTNCICRRFLFSGLLFTTSGTDGKRMYGSPLPLVSDSHFYNTFIWKRFLPQDLPEQSSLWSNLLHFLQVIGHAFLGSCSTRFMLLL